MPTLSPPTQRLTTDYVDIPLLHTTYELYKLFHQGLKSFPKTEKYSLGARIEQYILDTLELIIRTAYAPKADRLKYLEDLDAKIQLLKTLIRLAHEIRSLDDNKYLALQEHLQAMGKMAGGWLRSIRGNTNVPMPSRDV